jgi:hypothetical protein
MALLRHLVKQAGQQVAAFIIQDTIDNSRAPMPLKSRNAGGKVGRVLSPHL